MHSSDERALWLARHVLPHEPALRAWLRRKSVPGLDTDDIVQETYARLSALDSVEAIRDAKTYVFQAAHSVIVSHVRRSRIVPIQAVGHLEALDIATEQPDPECQAADCDELQRLAEAIAELPGKIRDVFVLRRVEGLSQREVAQQLGLSESTVEKHMSKSFRQLAALFGRGGKDPGGASKQMESQRQQNYADRDKPGD